MRGGYRVPAIPFGGGYKAIKFMDEYKITEISSSMAFAESQREMVLDPTTATACDNGRANFMYIATKSSITGTWGTDLRPAYYWIDNLEFLGAEDGEDPAAVITISPDVWLTDFFASPTTFRGRLAQSTHLIATDTPRTSLTRPVYDWQNTPVQSDALAGYQTGFYTVGIFSNNLGGISAYVIYSNDFARAKSCAQVMGGAATLDGITIPQMPQEQISCIRVYIVPAKFMSTVDDVSLVDTSLEYRITAAGEASLSVNPFSTSVSAAGLKKVLAVYPPATANGYNALYSKQWIVTPARFVDVSEYNGITNYTGGTAPIGTFYVSASSFGDDGIKIYLQCGSEFIDVSDDFIADFATNTSAVQQAQQKQLVALQAITGAVGATGGAVGGIASGNYFGAVQSIAGGVQSFANIAAARRTPAQMRGNGGVAAFYGFTNTLILTISMGTPLNIDEIESVENEFGWIFDNAPYFNYAAIRITEEYYRFSDVVVENMSGGTAAQEEVATAFTQGVRFVPL